MEAPIDRAATARASLDGPAADAGTSSASRRSSSGMRIGSAVARLRRGGSNSTSESPSPSSSSSSRMLRRQSYTSTPRDDTPSRASDAPQRSTAAKARRSDMHEREVSQIRSESRAGFSRDDDDDDDDGDDDGGDAASTARPFPSRPARPQRSGSSLSPRKSNLRAWKDDTGGESSTATDTSGTEGTQTTVGRKWAHTNTISSSSSGADTAKGRAKKRSTARHAAAGELQFPKSSSGHSMGSGESSRSSRPSSSRHPLPAEFRASVAAPRAAPVDADGNANTSTAGEGRVKSPTRSSTRYRRRRYASDAQASEIPTFDYSGRAGTNDARLSVDSSSATRYLNSRSRTSSGPQGPPPAGLRTATAMSAAGPRPYSRASQWDEDSPTEMLRARKISSASTGSYRPSSRISRRGGAPSGGAPSDVFSDNGDVGNGTRYPRGVPPPSTHSRGGGAGGLASDELTPEAIERVRALRMRRETLQAAAAAAAATGGKETFGSAVDDLRARIEDVDIRGGSTAGASSSRSSSALSSITRLRSGAQPHGHSLSTGPASEPRRGIIHHREFEGGASTRGHHRDFEEGASRTTASSRLSSLNDPIRRYTLETGRSSRESRDIHHNPHTPDTSFSGRPGSRFATTSRLGMVTPAPLPSLSSTANRPIPPHERNMQVSFDIFERYFSSSGGTAFNPQATLSPSSSARYSGPESDDLVDKTRRFLDTVATLNAGLRDLVQFVIQREIEAELQPGSAAAALDLATLKDLDAALGQLLKYSDNQVRNLGDVLVAFTKADRERSRARAADGQDHAGAGASAGASTGGQVRPESRLLRTGTPLTRTSPSRTDVRRSATLGHHAHLSLERWTHQHSHAHQHQHQPSLPTLPSLGSHAAAGSSGGTLRREMRDIRQVESRGGYGGSGAGSIAGSTSTRSDRSGGGSGGTRRDGDLTNRTPHGGYLADESQSFAADDVAARYDGASPSNSPTLAVGAAARYREQRHREHSTSSSAASSSYTHSRSFSEVSPGASASGSGRTSATDAPTISAGGTARWKRPLPIRESMAPARPPATLSPRRPKLSDPSVATATAVASSSTDTEPRRERGHDGELELDLGGGVESPALGLETSASTSTSSRRPPSSYLQHAASSRRNSSASGLSRRSTISGGAAGELSSTPPSAVHERTAQPPLDPDDSGSSEMVLVPGPGAGTSRRPGIGAGAGAGAGSRSTSQTTIKKRSSMVVSPTELRSSAGSASSSSAQQPPARPRLGAATAGLERRFSRGSGVGLGLGGAASRLSPRMSSPSLGRGGSFSSLPADAQQPQPQPPRGASSRTADTPNGTHAHANANRTSPIMSASTTAGLPDARSALRHVHASHSLGRSAGRRSVPGVSGMNGRASVRGTAVTNGNVSAADDVD